MLHVVGRVTEPVARFIGPSLSLLHGDGRPQELLLLDGPALSRVREAVPSGTALHRVQVPSQGGRWWALRRAFEQRLSRGPVPAVHFHGLLPWLTCMAGRTSAQPVYLSPHGSRGLSVLPALLPLMRQTPRLIATSDREAARLQRMGLIVAASHPVLEDVYLNTARHEAEVPTVAGGSYVGSRAAMSLFTRVSVLLAEAQPGLAFEWLGHCAPGAGAELDAAGIAHRDSEASAAIAESLGRAWLFLALTPDSRTPLLLAQAMAAGTACVALNTPSHAGLIRHGHNGLLVGSDADLKAAVCTLLDQPTLRRALGEQARQDALRLFGPGQLQRGLHSGYALGSVASLADAVAARDVGVTPMARAD